MAYMIHPATGESVRDEVVCHKYNYRTNAFTYYNHPTYEHEMERIQDTWYEIIDRCRNCGYEVNASVG